MGFETMADVVVGGRPALCLIAGDDAAAKATVARGGAVPLLEHLAQLWAHLDVRAGHGRGIASALLRRS